MKKLNKKGFTLIELLAVIVVLAIILVIAVPNVLDTINNSKKGVARDQAMLIFKAVETCVANEQALGTSVSDVASKCNTVDALKQNKYYDGKDGELISVIISSDGEVTSLTYLEKKDTKNVMCAYTNGTGKQSIVGGMTTGELNGISEVAANTCK